ncbi:MAG TPA: hypothetical protein VL749_06430 [Patescibacteria group bacterium]|nr:hypothetical protein [Patescibacteria group bacterium]
MTKMIHRLRGFLIAFAAIALSASLAFGAQPTSTGLANAAAHSGKTVPVGAADDQTTADETTDETTDESTDENAAPDENTDTADNCTTDPTTLTPEDLALMRHGSIVCWAAQQTTWPEWFSNHGSFVKCWAHQGKPDAQSCTEDPAAQAPTAAGASTGHGKSDGKGKGQGHSQ